MQESTVPLTLEFLRWIGCRPRTYAAAMDAWRTSCPRHSTWEDAFIDGLVQIENTGTSESMVSLTLRGREVLAENA